MRTIDRDTFIEAMNYAGLSEEAIYERYSGRAMYGATCFGFTVDTMGEAFALFATLAELDKPVSAATTVADLATAARTDDMGRGIIVYFPGYDLTPQSQETHQCQ